MTPDAIRNLQTSLGLPATGVFDAATSSAMSAAVSKAVASNADVQKYAGTNDPAKILTAYQTGDFSGLTDLTGKPFTDQQQQAAVAKAKEALAPAYEATKAYDQAGVEQTLQQDQQNQANFERDQGIQFGQDKQTLDKSAADNGVLFSGARIQKQNDLKTLYQNREADQQQATAGAIERTARDNQYAYGSDVSPSLSKYYSMSGPQTYNPGVATGGVAPSSTLSAIYNPGQYNFQGTKPVAQQANIQVRAANLLANRANKLSLSGVGTKF